MWRPLISFLPFIAIPRYRRKNIKEIIRLHKFDWTLPDDKWNKLKSQIKLFFDNISTELDDKPVNDLDSRDKAEAKAETDQTSNVGYEVKDCHLGGSLISWGCQWNQYIECWDYWCSCSSYFVNFLPHPTLHKPCQLGPTVCSRRLQISAGARKKLPEGRNFF